MSATKSFTFHRPALADTYCYIVHFNYQEVSMQATKKKVITP